MHACMAIIQHIHNFFYSLLDVKLRSPLQKDFLAWQVCVLGLNVHVWVGVGGGGGGGVWVSGSTMYCYKFQQV